MKFIEKLKNFINEYFFNPKWRCNVCGKEIFEDKFFCEDCYNNLPFNNGLICNHCGRKVVGAEEYCTTCKNVLVSIDKGRSVFNYEGEIRKLITSAKYSGRKYLFQAFAEEMGELYYKNNFNADLLCFVPTTDKALKKRGYNQSRILAQSLSKKINVPVSECLIKTKETPRQAKLNRAERLKNLQGVFKVCDKKEIKDKTIVLIDDVATTGSTSEVIASVLKNAGAKCVYLLSVASVPPIDGY